MRRIVKIGALVAGLLAMGSALEAQETAAWDGGRLELTRQGLEELVARYEQTAASSAYSPELRSDALREAEAARMRLRMGDFRTGDEIALAVEGEEGLNGTFLVNERGAILLPTIGEVPLQGVLRSELQDHLRRQLSSFLVSPVLTAYSSVRLMLSGSVTKPGIFVVPTRELLSTALMNAGGPAGTADLTAMRIERGSQILWEGEALQSAIAQGLTIDQLSLQSGDHVVIPATRAGSPAGQLLTTVVPAVMLLITSLAQVF